MSQDINYKKAVVKISDYAKNVERKANTKEREVILELLKKKLAGKQITTRQEFMKAVGNLGSVNYGLLFDSLFPDTEDAQKDKNYRAKILRDYHIELERLKENPQDPLYKIKKPVLDILIKHLQEEIMELEEAQMQGGKRHTKKTRKTKKIRKTRKH